jgi:hypothetical protein
MTQRQFLFRWILFTAAFGAALEGLGEPLEVQLQYLVAALGLVCLGGLIVVILLRGLAAWRVRRAVHLLRRFDAGRRETLLSGLPNASVRAALQRSLEPHGAPTIEGLVERFKFSPIDRREITAMMWAVLAAGVAAVFMQRAVGPGTLRSVVLGGCSLLLLGIALTFGWALVKWQRTFEVSPFGLSELGAEGSVRRIYWHAPLVLRNRPRLRRCELSIAGDADHIDIPYSVVGFERLIELILVRGGFPQAGSDAGEPRAGDV